MSRARSQPGIRDIAGHLSLSVGTISKALNGRPGVRPHVRRRVIKAAEQLGYVSDRSAQLLRRKRSRCIQWQIPTLRDLSYVETMTGLDEAAVRHGYEVAVTSYERDNHKLELLCRDAIAQRMEAVILMGGAGAVPVQRLLDAGIVILGVNCGPQPLPDGVASLDVNFSEGIRQMAHHLIQLGHRRFMVPDRFHHDARFQSGLSMALREARLPEDILIFETDHNAPVAEDLYNRVLAIFRENPHAATAIMSSNDQSAAGMIAAIEDAGLSVPGDVSVTGAGNIELAKLFRPAISTLSTTNIHMGEIAMDMLASILDGSAPRNLRRTLGAQMILRQSTGPMLDSINADDPPSIHSNVKGGSPFLSGGTL